MTFWNEFYGLTRFALGLRSFVQNPVSLEQAKGVIRRGMEQREAALIDKVERAIFRHERSPYLKLFRRAGCDLRDVKALALKEGVDGALEALRQAGIYVTFEEFKCRQPIRRGSDTFTVRETDFDNPWARPHIPSATGGSSGRPTRIIVDLDHIAETAPHHRIWFEDHGWMDRPLLLWSSTAANVANRHLLCARYGMRFEKWFCFPTANTARSTLAAHCVHALVRGAAGIPRPEMVPVIESWRIADCLLRLLKEGKRPCLITTPSQAIQIGLEAQAKYESLDGVVFLLGGEPLTPTRRKTIEQHGAQAVPTYGFAEGGNVGSQCSLAPVADDIHVSLDAYAAITRPHELGDGVKVDALLLTALRPSCPKVLFNTEIGDYAVMKFNRCDCLFGELGYRQHLHSIRSFNKLTGVGLTFLGADLSDLIEEILPRRFGGAAIDYQLVEREDQRGCPRYDLLVGPRVGVIDEQRLSQEFLLELAKRGKGYRWMTDIWDETGVLTVLREQPRATMAGKVLPVRTLGAE